MPRRGRSGGMSRPAPAMARPAPPPPRPAPLPAQAPPSAAAPMAAQPRQPGLFARMASTAAGVAVGSAVGHTIGHAMTSGGSAPAAEAAAPAAAPAPIAPAAPAAHQNYDPNNNPCQHHLQQFLECTQTQADISLCAGFNEALKECKLRFGLQ